MARDIDVTAVDDRTPVLVGLGEISARPGSEPAGEIPDFMARAIRAAVADAAGDASGADGTGPASTRAQAILDAAQAVAVAPSATWPDLNPGTAVAASLGLGDGVQSIRSSMVGGNGSQLIVNTLAERIQAGELDVALMVGAEALHSQKTAFEDFGDAASRKPEGSTEVLEEDHFGNSEGEIAVGFAVPVLGYALMEQALAADAGRSVSEQKHVAAELWSRFSQVAAQHPNAWVQQAQSAEQIETPTPGNRQVSHPYTKFMVANFRVDQAGALVLTSAKAARELGIDASKWVFVHAGAQANDEWFVSERAELHRSPAIRAIGEALFAHAGITAADLGPVDLYSCFPSAVQIAARELGLPTDDPARPLTETGGLTFFGGPGNNFGTHGVIGVARKLREATPGTLGVSSSLGWYATKHAYGLYGSSAPTKPYTTLKPTPAAAKRDVASPEDAAAAGELTVEVATALYGRDGAPVSGFLFALLPDGRRAIGGTTDPGVLAALVRDDFNGSKVTLGADRSVELVAAPAAR